MSNEPMQALDLVKAVIRLRLLHRNLRARLPRRLLCCELESANAAVQINCESFSQVVRRVPLF